MAAHLAAGAELADAGEPVEPDELQAIELPEPRIEDGTLVAHVLSLDRYGNAALNVGHETLAGTGLTLGRTVELHAGGEPRPATFTQTFADVPSGGCWSTRTPIARSPWRSTGETRRRSWAWSPATRCACGRSPRPCSAAPASITA